MHSIRVHQREQRRVLVEATGRQTMGACHAPGQHPDSSHLEPDFSAWQPPTDSPPRLMIRAPFER
jgi:hypothetical protein